jgi:hypothetical protein
MISQLALRVIACSNRLHARPDARCQSCTSHAPLYKLQQLAPAQLYTHCAAIELHLLQFQVTMMPNKTIVLLAAAPAG